MQPDSFMKKYYATSSEWDIFEFFAETMQHRRGYGAGGGGRNRDPYMAQQPQPGQQQYQQSPRQQHNYPESLGGGGGHGNMRHLPSASTLQVNHAAIASSSGIIIYNQKLIIFLRKKCFS